MKAAIIIKPQMSEKAYRQSQELNTYIFVVPKNASRQQVADMVAKQYKVEISTVRLAASSAKPLRFYRKRGRFIRVHHKPYKKAYVTLQSGQSLPFFTETEKSDIEVKKSDRKVL
ncbi:50S ribosomal protein L23 [Candidatus Saccharibacteria bacterium RIFCSPHIGHO2_12_FULL_47_16b]|nr:MAG: 50S ribosomal protein L23 [Candidatus Saccharibacteria bacterium RIFCSPHIGHO2_12_FULL_47_16b]